MNKIKVIDSIMGSYKTTNAFKMINESDKEISYIYVTPYLDEVERCKNMCNERNFHDPKHLGEGKLKNLHELLLNHENIATTHALFKMATEETYQLLEVNNYVLILDEVMGVIEQVNITKGDFKLLNDNCLNVDDLGNATWKDSISDYQGKFYKYKNMADNNNLVVINDTFLVWSFPINIFKRFKETYILTYIFDAQIQKYYFDRYNLNYEYYYSTVNGYHLQDKNYNESVKKEKLKNLINMYDGHLNSIGDKYYSLSKSWHIKNNDSLIMEQLNKNIYNYFTNITNTNSKDNMWTTFKDYKGDLKGSGYTKGFVSLNARATNMYSDKKSLAYCINIFLNPSIVQYFEKYDINIDQELYATSEFLQWIWRSQIRDNKPINLYVPSNRMRELLINWLAYP